MKFLFVVGGSYKRFYINELNKIKNIDLIIFNQDIFYDFDYEQEYLGDGLVSSELINLNKMLKCPIVVCGLYKFLNNKKKCFIICVNNKVSVIERYKDVYLYIKGRIIQISNKVYKTSKAFSTISMLDTSNKLELIPQKSQHNYFVCDKKSVTRLQSGRIYRKFQKCCYFTLRVV